MPGFRPDPRRRSPRAGRPRNTRPGRRGATSRPATDHGPLPRARFTSRMAILLVVFALLVVSYASSMRAYLQQRSQVQALQGQIASSRHQIALLEREKRRWHDNAYVEAMARERFGWVLPGETAYQVIGKDGKPLQDSSRLGNPAAVGRTVPEAWWSKAYGSLRAADHPPAPKPKPATRISPRAAKKQ